MKRFLLILTLLLLATGCIGRRTTPPGPDTAGGSVAGAAYTYYRWPEGTAVMLWFDTPFATASSGGSGSTEDPLYQIEGDFTPGSGEPITWTLVTRDGVNVGFELDGQAYDVDDGNIFLIRTRGEEISVEQLTRDLSGVTPEQSSVEAFARSDPALSAFIAEE